MLSGGATQPSWFSEHGEEKKDALAMLFSHIENGLSLLSTPRNGAEAGRSDAGSVCLGCFAGSEATRTFGLFADLHCGDVSRKLMKPRQGKSCPCFRLTSQLVSAESALATTPTRKMLIRITRVPSELILRPSRSRIDSQVLHL
jgi:hypothetical protein